MKRNVWRMIVAMAAVLIFGLYGSGWADAGKAANIKETGQVSEPERTDSNPELEHIKRRLDEVERQVKENPSEVKDLVSMKEALDRFTIGGGITGILQGTFENDKNPPSSQMKPGVVEDGFQRRNVTDGSYSMDLEIGVKLDKYGRAFVHLEGGQGEGVGRQLYGFVCREHGEAKPIFTGVNADALGEDGTLTIAEAYWEIPLFSEKLFVTLGKLDPVAYFDGNAVANDETTQFMADIFVNNISVDWPDYTPGLRVTINPDDLIEINLGVLSGDSDFADLFNQVFALGELNLKPKLFGKFQGNYRLYYWANGRHHMTWENAEAKERSKGFGLSFDQQVTPGVTLFARYGIQDDDIKYDCEEFNLRIKDFWSIGGEIKGALWERENDALGLAYGQARPMDKLKKHMKAAGADPSEESHLEIYYSLAIGEHVSISPDFQIIFNPGGNDKADTVYVAGIRAQLSF